MWPAAGEVLEDAFRLSQRNRLTGILGGGGWVGGGREEGSVQPLDH